MLAVLLVGGGVTALPSRMLQAAWRRLDRGGQAAPRTVRAFPSARFLSLADSGAFAARTRPLRSDGGSSPACSCPNKSKRPSLAGDSLFPMRRRSSPLRPWYRRNTDESGYLAPQPVPKGKAAPAGHVYATPMDENDGFYEASRGPHCATG
jgi:hypothetical protein